jgi:hypothetical protein
MDGRYFLLGIFACKYVPLPVLSTVTVSVKIIILRQGVLIVPIYRQNSKPATDYKRDLQKYFSSHNLGEVPYKVAPVGSRGKEKYMATVTVEGTQFKTYPQTYNSRVSSLLSGAWRLTPLTPQHEIEFSTVKVESPLKSKTIF